MRLTPHYVRSKLRGIKPEVIKGLGLGIPVIFIITVILSYIKLKTKKTTSWDQSAKSFVYCGRLNFMRVFIAILLVFIVLIFSVGYDEKKENTFNKIAEKPQTKKENDFLKEIVFEEDRMNSLNLEEISASTALIISDTEDGLKTGSGFCIDKSLLVTNSHVIENAIIQDGLKIVYIETQQNIRDMGYVFAEDKKNDLAIIKTIKNVHESLSLGDYSQVKMGDEIFVLGSPQGLVGTLSKGIVSAKRRGKDFQLLQITASMSQGSSGSPVLSKDLKVIAIASSIMREGQNINFAVPVFYLKKLVRDNKKTLIKISKLDLESKLGEKNIWDSKTYKSIIDKKIENLKSTSKSKIYKQTFEKYQKLAMQGDASAQNNLGVMYDKGEGVVKNYKEAFKWYKKAAVQGYVPNSK